MIVVVEVFVAQSQAEDPLPQQLLDRVFDQFFIAIIDETPGQSANDARLLLDLPQQQSAGIRGDRPTIEVFKHIYKDRLFYQLYSQEPGVAEAELEADPAATIRRVYYGASGNITDEECAKAAASRLPFSRLVTKSESSPRSSVESHGQVSMTAWVPPYRGRGS